MSVTSIPLVERRFTRQFNGDSPIARVEWGPRDVKITDASGKVYFEQRDTLFPVFWSDDAVRITASKYFRGGSGANRENNLAQMIKRVVNQITRFGRKELYFDSDEEANGFSDELVYLLVNQMAAFNSPVWFNCGATSERSSGYCWDVVRHLVRRVEDGEHRPQCSACFIVSVDDNMESILDWVKTEGMIFKQGSGSGANLSKLRSSRELLSSGGRPSGPIEFMKINDQAAGSIKSGGKHRRAAKMVILNSDHPDIFEFTRCKAKEEHKIRKLVEAGWPNDFNNPEGAQASAFFQNANHSVSVDDAFMKAVVEGGDYATHPITGGGADVVEVFKARKLMREIAQAAWECGDPGVQFRTTMNQWNMVAKTGVINGTNPCSEFVFLDDTSCNLASLNLMKFRNSAGGFDSASFRQAVRVMILAQDILVDLSSYPTETIAQNSHSLRPLGLGYANLGAYVMSHGYPYDSELARRVASEITAIMTGEAYLMSTKIAQKRKAFERFEENADSAYEVLARHQAAVAKLPRSPLQEEAVQIWREVYDDATVYGLRNAQVTVLAPTGTIGFMMGVDTTGVEPELSLVKNKQLVGGGSMQITNETVGEALDKLGYSPRAVEEILNYISHHNTVEGSRVRPEHYAVFDTAFPAGKSQRIISYFGHLRMMEAVQPFLSGAISKTVNMPESATVEDVQTTIVEAWKMGLKSVAIYRNNSKGAQPLTQKEASKPAPASVNFAEVESKVCGIILELAKLPADERRKKIQAEYGALFGSVDPVELLDSGCHRKMVGDRMGIVHEFKIAGHKGYLTVGLYPDGSPGEIFLDMAKEGSTISGLLDAFAISMSFNLQHGVPLNKLVDKFQHSKFEPAGITDDPNVRMCDSVIDYIVRWMEIKFLKPKKTESEPEPLMEVAAPVAANDAPICMECGNVMQRSGSCFKCPNCGGTSGCS